MPYSPLTWVDGVTALDATNFNHLEQGVDLVTEDVEKRVGALARTSAVNLDTVVENGWYTIPAGTANAPIAQKGYLKVEKPDDSWVRQVFYQYDLAAPGPNYVRVYNPTPGTWTAWAPAVAGADLSFDGDWAAGTYQDGDTVVKDGVVFICVGGPTAVAPDASLWGIQSPPQIPTVQNGKWLKGVGGAMVWDDTVGFNSGTAVNAANTDIAFPGGTMPVTFMQISTTGGGTLRTVGVGSVLGQRLVLRNGGNPVITLLNNVAGAGASLRFRDSENVSLASGDSVEFYWHGTFWIEINRDTNPIVGRDSNGRDITNIATEQSMFSGAGGLVIPGGVMGVNRTLRCTIIGDYLHNTNNNLTLRIKFGATYLYQITVGTTSVGALRQGFVLQFFLSNLSATAQFLAGTLITTNPQGTAPITGFGNLWPDMHAGSPRGGQMGGTAAEDTSVNKTLDATAQYSGASTSSSWRSKYILTELI